MTIDEIKEWYFRPRTPFLSAGTAVEATHGLHPRTMFLKSLPRDAHVLDMGAGDGSLGILKAWPSPDRSDLKLHAVSLDMGIHFEKYESYELVNWEATRPDFGGRLFDAIIASHFIEHVTDPELFISWASSRLKAGGSLYLEWPHESSCDLPPRMDLMPHGISLSISNFYDDNTHLKPLTMAFVANAVATVGLTVEQQGRIRLPMVEEELLAHYALKPEDPYSIQFAFWSRTGWCQYVLGRKLHAVNLEPGEAPHTTPTSAGASGKSVRAKPKSPKQQGR